MSTGRHIFRWDVTPQEPQVGARVKIVADYGRLAAIGFDDPDIIMNETGTVTVIDLDEIWYLNVDEENEIKGAVVVKLDGHSREKAWFPYPDWQPYLELI